MNQKFPFIRTFNSEILAFLHSWPLFPHSWVTSTPTLLFVAFLTFIELNKCSNESLQWQLIKKYKKQFASHIPFRSIYNLKLIIQTLCGFQKFKLVTEFSCLVAKQALYNQQSVSPCVHEWTDPGPTNMGFTRRFATRVGDENHPLNEGRISSHLRLVPVQLGGALALLFDFFSYNNIDLALSSPPHLSYPSYHSTSLFSSYSPCSACSLCSSCSFHL